MQAYSGWRWGKHNIIRFSRDDGMEQHLKMISWSRITLLDDLISGDLLISENILRKNWRTVKVNLNLEWRVFSVEPPLDFNTFSQAITKQNAHAHNILKTCQSPRLGSPNIYRQVLPFKTIYTKYRSYWRFKRYAQNNLVGSKKFWTVGYPGFKIMATGSFQGW